MFFILENITATASEMERENLEISKLKTYFDGEPKNLVDQIIRIGWVGVSHFA